MVNIEINGKKIAAREGVMVIEAADDAGIYIPRFCYHKKLSIAANCRMCRVEVEKVGKPLPACATPVTNGMKIFTKSPKAIEAQRGVMEFLLINHPLDCPICDQGGECELQDIAMGFGGGVSHYSEQKRVVPDKNLGPLISTDMTRCIHCTRCVRFGEEISGVRELGATGRGEHMEIGTYIVKSVASELSGNVIDLCPVGALTSKPFRFSCRSWEMVQRDTVAPHDCLGSNLHTHVRDNKVQRIVPRENEQINETWISDRDRFSYEGLYSADRLKVPMVKVNGRWQETDWESALEFTVKGLRDAIGQHGPSQVGALASATATLEELYLFQKLMRDLEIHNIDHRIRQNDFSADYSTKVKVPVFPWLGQSIESFEQNDAILLVGSNVRKDQPIAAHRIRKATAKNAKVMCVNSVDYEFFMPMAERCIVSPNKFVSELAAIAKAMLDLGNEQAPEKIKELLASVTPDDTHRAIAKNLINAKQGSVILGLQAISHETATDISAMANIIAKLSQSRFGYLTDAGNTTGAWLAGVLPHRECGGEKVTDKGLNALDMFKHGLAAYLLLDLEPEIDSAMPSAANSALIRADFVASFCMYKSKAAEQYASVMLPIAAFTETSGTYVNVEGRWQSFKEAVDPYGEAKPAWKIFRVIGNFFDLVGYDYSTSEEIRDEVKEQLGDVVPNNDMDWLCPSTIESKHSGVMRVSEMQMYAGDSVQRRAKSLHQTADAIDVAVHINSGLAKRVGLSMGDQAIASQNGKQVILPVNINERVADDCVVIPSGLPQTAMMDNNLSEIKLSRG